MEPELEKDCAACRRALCGTGSNRTRCGVTAELTERLEPSHDLHWSEPARRYLGDPAYRAFGSAGLSLAQQQMLISELRPIRTSWLWAVPRAQGPL